MKIYYRVCDEDSSPIVFLPSFVVLRDMMISRSLDLVYIERVDFEESSVPSDVYQFLVSGAVTLCDVNFYCKAYSSYLFRLLVDESLSFVTEHKQLLFEIL